ncbi:MAG: hypothetical protein KAI62_07780 [Actinomycetia bacterium]|nr:hypothetical protein [Actinomycetes bacterium]
MNNSRTFLTGNETGSGSLDGDSIILSTRVGLARNIANHKFPSSNTLDEKNQIIKIVRDCIGSTGGLPELHFHRLSRLTRIQRQMILDDYQIDDDFVSKLPGRAILLSPRLSLKDNAVSILLCWDDHIRIQVSSPGSGTKKAYIMVGKIEKLLESKLSFSFDREWGYLTSNPADLGTALEVSVMAHLPALAISPEIAGFIKNLTKVGCSISGFSGINSEVTGNLFRISSSKTLGKSEEEIVEEMQAICLNIVEEEEDSRKKLVEKDLLGAKDNIYRSFGLIKYAKILSFEEALELLSILRLGLDLGIIEKTRDFDLFELINIISDSHIISNYEIEGPVSDDDIDLKRADLIRERVLEE